MPTARQESEVRNLVSRLSGLTAADPGAWPEVNLTLTQLRALFVIRPRPVRMSDLASALAMSLASASALGDRLVHLGVVARRRDLNDRRSVLIELSPSGASLLRRLQRAQAQRMTRAVRGMTAAEREALLVALRALVRVAPLAPSRERPRPARGTAKRRQE